MDKMTCKLVESLYIIVVNWNLKDEALACIESLVSAGANLTHIIMVDNGSDDGSVPALKERFPLLQLITSSQNLGFAGGCNLGIQSALKQGGEWLLLLNNDTYVAPTFLRELEKVVECREHHDIIGPVILYHDSPKRIWYFGDRLIPKSLATVTLYRGQQDDEKFPPLVPVDFVSGCAMLVNQNVFKTVGLFDTTFFMYGEDVDLCWRARTAGFRLAVATRAKMWHRVSASSERSRTATRYLRIRNQIRFYRHYSRGAQIPLMVLFTLLRAAYLAAGDLIHEQPFLVGPLVRGWLDGWLGTSTGGVGR